MNSMNHFLYRLIPPRPTFLEDMSETEGTIMEAHFGYWAGVITERQAVAYGPVMDPAGVYGVAVLEVVDEATARSIAANDPANKSNGGFRFELHPMVDAIVRP
jgi:hypothetical protein